MLFLWLLPTRVPPQLQDYTLPNCKRVKNGFISLGQGSVSLTEGNFLPCKVSPKARTDTDALCCALCTIQNFTNKVTLLVRFLKQQSSFGLFTQGMNTRSEPEMQNRGASNQSRSAEAKLTFSSNNSSFNYYLMLIKHKFSPGSSTSSHSLKTWMWGELKTYSKSKLSPNTPCD